MIFVAGRERDVRFFCAQYERFDVVHIDLKLSPGLWRLMSPHRVDLASWVNKEEFDRKFLNFIAELGRRYNSKYWWANSLSEKNEFLSPFYQRLFYVYAIHRYLQTKKAVTAPLLILCRDGEIVRGLKEIDEQYHYGIKIQASVFSGLRKTIKNLVRFLVKTVLMVLSGLGKSVSSKFYLRSKMAVAREIPQRLVIKTVIDKRNYKGGRYQDAYFGPLVDYLKQQAVPFCLIGEVVQDYADNLRRMAADQDHVILSTDAFLGIFDVMAVSWESLWKRLKISGEILFEDAKITPLVQAELDECFFSAKFLENLLSYRKTLRLAQSIRFKSYLYTFENYAWEKMGVMALKDSKTRAKIIGFQHAFISKNSFRYFPGQCESDIMPVPDKIVTMGEITKLLLQRCGDYKSVEIQVGCALRQERTLAFRRIVENLSRNIFVPLTISETDTVKVLNFIYKAGLGQYPHNVFLRFHPLTDCRKVFAQIDFRLPQNFVVSKNVPLQEEFKRSGVVLYTWTTVCLEALLVGLPVIYLDINFPLNLDPIFELSYLKETVSRPEDLLPTIERLLNIKTSEYQWNYDQTRGYLQRYFSPVTEENLEHFVG